MSGAASPTECTRCGAHISDEAAMGGHTLCWRCRSNEPRWDVWEAMPDGDDEHLGIVHAIDKNEALTKAQWFWDQRRPNKIYVSAQEINDA